MANLQEPRQIAGFASTPGRWKRYPAYKPSGVDWLGPIPTHWEVKHLKYAAKLNPDVLAEETDPDSVLSYVDITNVDSRGVIISPQDLRFEDAPSRARRKVQHGDTVLSTVRTYLKAIAYVEHPPDNLIVSTGFAVLRPGPEWHARFLYRLVQSHEFVETVVAHSEGVGYPAINPGGLASLGVWLPPSSEQQAIAAFLDRETAKIDALVAKKERLIELLEEKRTALITHTVTNGLNRSAPMKDSGVEWLGGIPAGWEIKRLKYLTPDRRPIMYGIVLPGPNVDDGVPIVKGGDVAPGHLRLDLLNRTTREIEAGYARSRLRSGDIVYAIRGSIGSAELVPAELDGANLTQDAARVAPRSGTEGRWLLFALKSQATFAQLDAGAMGAAVRGVNIRDLKRAIIAVPRGEEQPEVAAFLNRETAEIDALIAKVREHMERLREYRGAVISAAVTGRIDVRGEVAS